MNIVQASSSLKTLKVTGLFHPLIIDTAWTTAKIKRDLSFLNNVETKLECLQWIQLNGTKNATGLANLITKSPNLQKLQLIETELDDVCVTTSKISSLRQIDFYNCQGKLTPYSSLLTNVPELQFLNVGDCKLPQAANFSCQFPKLVALELINSPSLVPAFGQVLPKVRVSYLQQFTIFA